MSDNKKVTILARIEFKADSKKVCYRCLSSNGKDIYTTCLWQGKACSCSCPSRKLECRHAIACEAREAERENAREYRRMAEMAC
jgi:hypothetical protein